MNVSQTDFFNNSSNLLEGLETSAFSFVAKLRICCKTATFPHSHNSVIQTKIDGLGERVHSMLTFSFNSVFPENNNYQRM